MSEDTTIKTTETEVQVTEAEEATAPDPRIAELEAQVTAERAKTQKAVAEEKKLRERLKTLDATSQAAKTAEERLAEIEAERAELSGKLSAADTRVIRAEAKAEALRQGVKPERLTHALKLADLSGVEFNEDGDPDEKAIKAAIKAVIEDLPELKGAPANVGGGSNPGAGANKLNPHQNMNAAIRAARSGS